VVRSGAVSVSIVRQRAVRTTDEWRLAFLVIATIPAAVAGLTVEDLAETTFRSPRLIAINLMLMGVVLWLVDRVARRDRPLDGMRTRDAVTIGFISASRCCRVFPLGLDHHRCALLGFDRQAAVFSS
jgi:undecaprenyl pyrophosphate phosphatase UppP